MIPFISAKSMQFLTKDLSSQRLHVICLYQVAPRIDASGSLHLDSGPRGVHRRTDPNIGLIANLFLKVDKDIVVLLIVLVARSALTKNHTRDSLILAVEVRFTIADDASLFIKRDFCRNVLMMPGCPFVVYPDHASPEGRFGPHDVFQIRAIDSMVSPWNQYPENFGQKIILFLLIEVFIHILVKDEIDRVVWDWYATGPIKYKSRIIEFIRFLVFKNSISEVKIEKIFQRMPSKAELKAKRLSGRDDVGGLFLEADSFCGTVAKHVFV